MINLQDFEAYINGLSEKSGAKKTFFLTAESDIKPMLQDITPEEQPFLMVIIPSAQSKGSTQDNVSEVNLALVYLLKKHDVKEQRTFDVQKELQPHIEAMKSQLISDKEECGIMRELDLSSMHTDPENQLFSALTGWSLTFEFDTARL